MRPGLIVDLYPTTVLMKKFCTTLFLLCLAALGNHGLAARFTDGYIISDGDTLRCKIKIQETLFGLDEYRLQSEITTRDSANSERKYTPANLQGFGFTFNNEPINYVAKVLEGNKRALFVKVINLGPRLSLFKYEERNDHWNYGGANKFGPSRTTTVTRHYVILDEAKREVVLSNSLFAGNSKKFREFLKEQPDLLQLYEQKNPSFQDIPGFVQAANTL